MAQEFEVGVSKLESPPTAGGKFTQVFESAPEVELLDKRGLLFAVVDLAVDPDTDPAVAAKLVWDTLSEEYYALPSEEAQIAALERAVYAARGKLRQLSPKSTLELAVFAFSNDVVYAARVGRTALYLRRGPDVRNLLPGEEATSIGSSILEGNDLLVLGSAGFARSFSPQTLPETQLLAREFEKGGHVPGLAGFLFEIRSSAEAEREISPKLTATIVSQVLSKAAWAKGILGKAFSTMIPAVRKRFPNLPAFNLRGRISMPKLIAVLAVVFAVSIAFTLWQQAKKVQAEEFERLVAQATSGLNDAGGLVGLSNEKAKELIDQAQADLFAAQKLSADNSRIDPLLQKAVDLFNAIEKITPVEEANLAYSLAEEARGISLVGSGGTIYLANEKSEVFAITLSDPPVSEKLTVGGSELVVEENYLYLRSADKLSRFNLEGKTADEPIGFDRFDKVAAMGTYLGNIYFLVPEEDQVYKFLVTQSGYSSARSWVEEAIDLQDAVDVAIDGDIWILTGQGKISRLAKGASAPFVVTNLSTPFQNPNKIFTRPNFKNLYVLDKGLARAVVLDKNGDFVRQFKGDVLSDLTDLWVSNDEKTLFLLSGPKIYQISL